MMAVSMSGLRVIQDLAPQICTAIRTGSIKTISTFESQLQATRSGLTRRSKRGNPNH
jgi:hypothetical protein